jgi:hypothetical protein
VRHELELPADPYALLYVACIETRDAGVCDLAILWIPRANYDRESSDPARNRAYEAEWGVRHPVTDRLEPLPGFIGAALEKFACLEAHDVQACVARTMMAEACALGDQPSCDWVVMNDAFVAEIHAKQAADEAAEAALRAQQAEAERAANPSTSGDDPGPAGDADDEIGPVSAADADYLSEDWCRMAYGFQCTKWHDVWWYREGLRGDDLQASYMGCLADAEDMLPSCERIRCGTRFYNCMSHAYSPDDFSACTRMANVCGLD